MNNQYHNDHIFQYWHSKGIGGYKWVGSKTLCNVNDCTIKSHDKKANTVIKKRRNRQ
jgi:hypothetical protein